MADDRNVYKTERGAILRISQDDDGHLSVEMLEGGAVWAPAPTRMAGLRISPTTRRLTIRQIDALPS